MKKSLKISFSTLAAFLFFVSSTAIAQQSDYQIQQDFRAEYRELANRIDNAVSSDDLSDIVNDIDELEANYSEYSDLLNNALYPDTFSDRIDDLRSRFGISEENINVIEQLNERVSSLEGELENYRNQLETIDAERQDLETRMEEASSNERRLSALVRQYRQNIEQRDAFTSQFLESLIERYQSIDPGAQSEISEASERLQDNPVELIKTIIAEYTNSADQASGLEASDYVGMRAQHGYFSDVWGRIGDRLSETFAPDNPVQTEQEVSDLLAAWQASIDNKLWNALTTAFNQNGIELPTFTSADAFNSALNTYVDNAIDLSMETNSEEDYERFQNFTNYWNDTVKGNWGELITNGNVLSHSQIAAIDTKLSNWGETATPTSNLMFILFLVSLAVIIGLVVLLVTRKG
ncbi:MAG: hypothetical protein WEA56_00825 [Balneolaceae bacterium]